MKHLFLSGKRIDEINELCALFQESENKAALYYEPQCKFLEGSLERWLAEHGIENLDEDSLPSLCGYSPPRGQAAPTKKLQSSTDAAIRMKLQKLRTTTWFQEDLFPSGHDWYATATSGTELEEIFEFVREIDTAAHEGDVFTIFVCNVGEAYEINPRQLGGLHFVGFGMPSLRIVCSYREAINLQRLNLSFDGFKLESSCFCRLIVLDGEVKDCEIASTFQVIKGGENI